MLTPETITDAAIGVLGRWDLGPVLAVDPATSGTMNETFVVTTAQRRVVLRRHRRPRRDQIEFEHSVITHARIAGIPAPAVIPTPDGETIVHHQGAFYSLFAFAHGHQHPRTDLTPTHAQSMGTMLARLDGALASFPMAPRATSDRPSDLAPVAARVDQLLREIEARERQSEQDCWAVELLRTKAAWLQTATPPVWRQPPVEALQLVHGDYQESNLFFDAKGCVVDVIDWDKAGSGWPPAEIVRTFDLALGMDPALCTAFVAGYRNLRPITLDDLDHAANNWNYSRVHDHWVLEGIYLRHDDRLRIFIRPGPFVPFENRWRQLRAQLS